MSTKSTTRVIGYYEVKKKDSSVRIAAELRSSGYFYICGNPNGFLESDFDYISEKPLISENDKK